MPLCHQAIEPGQAIEVGYGHKACHAACWNAVLIAREGQPQEECFGCKHLCSEEFWKNHSGLCPVCWGR
ncbi:MAG TPA: hypothetical protein VHE12_05700 [bacterium]|nr:hypothetical protein [bacterium]